MKCTTYFRNFIISIIIFFSSQNISAQIKEDAEIIFGNQSFKLVKPSKTVNKDFEKIHNASAAKW